MKELVFLGATAVAVMAALGWAAPRAADQAKADSVARSQAIATLERENERTRAFKAAAETACLPPPAAAASAATVAAAVATSSPASVAAVADGGRVHLQPLPSPLHADKDGNATVLLGICRDGSDALPLTLQAGPYTEALDGTRRDLSAKFSVAGGSQTIGIAAGKTCEAVRLDLGKLLSTGPMAVPLANDGAVIGTLLAVRDTTGFDPRIVGPNPALAEVTLFRNQAARVQVFNPDTAPYQVSWRWELGAADCGGAFTLAPRSTHDLHVQAASADFSWPESGFLRSGAQKGRLTLRREPGVPGVAAEPKVFDIVGRYDYHGRLMQPIWNGAWVLALLVVGLLVSLGVNFALPTQRRLVGNKQLLADLAAELNGQGGLIELRTLNVLRVELSRMQAELDARWPFFPETEAVLKRSDDRIAAFRSRLTITRAASACLAELRTLPLTLDEHEAAYVRCRKALQLMEMASPTDADLRRAGDEIAAVMRDIGAAAAALPDAAMQAALANRLARVPDALTATLPATAPPAAVQAWAGLNDLLKGLRADASRPAADRPGYVAQAAAVWKSELVAVYDRLVANAAPGRVQDGRIARAQDLYDAIAPGPKESPQRARRLLREIDQNIGPEQVVAGLQQQPFIRVDPAQPEPLQPVTLCICFADPGLDAAEARKSFRCEWTVDDGPPVHGDEMSVDHYFEGRRYSVSRYAIQATVRAPDGQPYVISSKPVELPPRNRYAGSSNWLSAASQSVTVVVVAIGLWAAAQEKLQTVDWWAGLLGVLLVGYGADALKRVLTRP